MDLISRQAAIEALGEMPEVWEEDDDEGRGEQNQWYMDKIAIEALPAAESEIIRCKDCYHYPSEYSDCPMIGWFRHEDDYCSRAERRTDG